MEVYNFIILSVLRHKQVEEFWWHMLETSESTCKRAEKYIRSTKKILNEIRKNAKEERMERLGLNFKKLLDSIQRYLDDAKYFIEIRKCETALVASSYAEGLLDSLRYMDLVEIPWNEIYESKKVFVAGTFEIVHPGHLKLLEFASRLGEVYVVVARDSNVKNVKGREPIVSENTRLQVIKAIKYVKEAYLGHLNDMLESVNRIKPDIIVLGPDQNFKENELADIIHKKYGFRPEVIRFPKKEVFGEGMFGVRDIYRRVCKEFCQKNQ